MDRTERFYKIEKLLRQRKVASFAELQSELEVSRSTLKRDLDYLRTRLNVPIEWSRQAGGYQLVESAGRSDLAHELPGLWFSSTEIHALLTMQHLLNGLDSGGLLTPHVAPLMDRLNALLGSANNDAQEVRRRVHIIALDAWCHLRRGLRNFAVDAMTDAQLLDTPAKEVSDAKLDALFGPSYGIFSGSRIRWARLRFTPERARWVASEQWHPQQEGKPQADGSYLLRLPYADHRELIMDILKHGTHCEVLGPPSLRQAVAEEVGRMGEKYF